MALRLRLTVAQPSPGKLPGMPDEDQLFLAPTRPPRFDEQHLTRSDLEFVMGQIASLPTRRGGAERTPS